MIEGEHYHTTQFSLKNRAMSLHCVPEYSSLTVPMYSVIDFEGKRKERELKKEQRAKKGIQQNKGIL